MPCTPPAGRGRSVALRRLTWRSPPDSGVRDAHSARNLSAYGPQRRASLPRSSSARTEVHLNAHSVGSCDAPCMLKERHQPAVKISRMSFCRLCGLILVVCCVGRVKWWSLGVVTALGWHGRSGFRVADRRPLLFWLLTSSQKPKLFATCQIKRHELD